MADQATAFTTPKQVINPLTGETVPDFELQKGSLDRTIPSPNRLYPGLLYKRTSAGKVISVRYENEVDKQRALAQGFHVGMPAEKVEIIEAQAEGLQPLSILGEDAPDEPDTTPGDDAEPVHVKKRGRPAKTE